MKRKIAAFAALFLGCSRPEALVVMDPFWAALQGPQAHNIITQGASEAGFSVRIVTPAPALPPAAVAESLRVGPETAGVVLSPFYSGEMYSWFRLQNPDLPLSIPLGPASLAENRTSVVTENRDGAFYEAGLAAGRDILEREGEPLLIALAGDAAADSERAAFLRGWADAGAPGQPREILLSVEDALPARVSAVRTQLDVPPSAVYILAGAASAEILKLYPDVAFGIEGLEGLPASREGLLFRIDRNWKGLFAKAFEGLKLESGAVLTFFLDKATDY